MNKNVMFLVLMISLSLFSCGKKTTAPNKNQYSYQDDPLIFDEKNTIVFKEKFLIDNLTFPEIKKFVFLNFKLTSVGNFIEKKRIKLVDPEFINFAKNATLIDSYVDYIYTNSSGDFKRVYFQLAPSVTFTESLEKGIPLVSDKGLNIFTLCPEKNLISIVKYTFFYRENNGKDLLIVEINLDIDEYKALLKKYAVDKILIN